MRASRASLALLTLLAAPGLPPYAACGALARLPARLPTAPVQVAPAGALLAPGLSAPSLAPALSPSLALSPSPLSGAPSLSLQTGLLAAPAAFPAPSAPALAPASASAAPAEAPRPGGLLERLASVQAPRPGLMERLAAARPEPTLRERLAALETQGRPVEFDGAAARASDAGPVAAAADAPPASPALPRSAGPSPPRRYYLTGAATGETRFGPAGYFVHFGVLKGMTIFLKSQVLFLAGGLPALIVYLGLLPVKVPAFVRIQSILDHQFARPFASSIAGALRRRGLKLPGGAPLNPRDELALMPGATAVLQGSRHEPRPSGPLSLGGSVVNRMGHRFRFLVAADRPLDPALAPARAGGLAELDGDAPVTLTAHRGAHALGVRWTMTVSEFLAGRAMDRGKAAELREAAGRSWLRDGAARAFFYVLASVAAGALFHPLHLDVAVGVTVFILLELNHKAHGLELWRKHFGAGADRSRTAAERRRAFRSEAWSRVLEDKTLRIEASVATPGGEEALGAVASGFGALRMAGAGLRQQARALELPGLFIALAAVFSALSAFGAWGLEPSHAVLALVFVALAAGMAGGFRALWRHYSGKRKPVEKGRPVGATRFVKLDKKVPTVALGALVVFGAAAAAGLSWPLLTAVGALAGLVALLDLHKFLTGVTRTPGGGHGGWLWELLDLLLTP